MGGVRLPYGRVPAQVTVHLAITWGRSTTTAGWLRGCDRCGCRCCRTGSCTSCYAGDARPRFWLAVAPWIEQMKPICGGGPPTRRSIDETGGICVELMTLKTPDSSLLILTLGRFRRPARHRCFLRLPRRTNWIAHWRVMQQEFDVIIERDSRGLSWPRYLRSAARWNWSVHSTKSVLRWCGSRRSPPAACRWPHHSGAGPHRGEPGAWTHRQDPERRTSRETNWPVFCSRYALPAHRRPIDAMLFIINAHLRHVHPAQPSDGEQESRKITIVVTMATPRLGCSTGRTGVRPATCISAIAWWRMLSRRTPLTGERTPPRARCRAARRRWPAWSPTQAALAQPDSQPSRSLTFSPDVRPVSQTPYVQALSRAGMTIEGESPGREFFRHGTPHFTMCTWWAVGCLLVKHLRFEKSPDRTLPASAAMEAQTRSSPNGSPRDCEACLKGKVRSSCSLFRVLELDRTRLGVGSRR